MKFISQPIDFYAQNIYNGIVASVSKDSKPKYKEKYLLALEKTGGVNIEHENLNIVYRQGLLVML